MQVRAIARAMHPVGTAWSRIAVGWHPRPRVNRPRRLRAKRRRARASRCIRARRSAASPIAARRAAIRSERSISARTRALRGTSSVRRSPAAPAAKLRKLPPRKQKPERRPGFRGSSPSRSSMRRVATGERVSAQSHFAAQMAEFWKRRFAFVSCEMLVPFQPTAKGACTWRPTFPAASRA